MESELYASLEDIAYWVENPPLIELISSGKIILYPNDVKQFTLEKKAMEIL